MCPIMNIFLSRPILPMFAIFLAAFSGSAPLKAAEAVVPDTPSIPRSAFKITDYGAVGDGQTMNTRAFHKAFKAAQKAGGGRVIVPKGIFLTQSFEMPSKTALMLEAGAVIQAPTKFSQLGFPDPLPTTQAGMDALKKMSPSLITASNANDIAILGEGTIDGAGAMWWANSEHLLGSTGKPYLNCPDLIVFNHCNRVHIAGVTLQNSPMFHLVPQSCSNVLIENITIHSPANSPNTDGIDPSNCDGVLIRGCTIDTGDDDVALKASGTQPCQNVTVTDCTIKHGHGISIGSETISGVSNFLVQNCTFENTVVALRIKSARTRGGKIEDLVYRNITMKNVQMAIEINFDYYDRDEIRHPRYEPFTLKTPMLSKVHFEDITCEDAQRAGEICGLPESNLKQVDLKNVHITAGTGLLLQDIGGIGMHNVSVTTSTTLKKREKEATAPSASSTPGESD